MDKIEFTIPFGKNNLVGSADADRLLGVYASGVDRCRPPVNEVELVRRALDNPLGGARLEEWAVQARTALIIASDHTRPVPSRILMPELLHRLRAGNPAIEISILIAAGCHRATTHDELIAKFGNDIVCNERILNHDCGNDAELVPLGPLPSGAELLINRHAAETDLLLAEGFIEPHFFAGFSGGRKSVLPGIAGRRTVLGNHCAAFIASPAARAGILRGNPLHRDMTAAARKARLRFILNVVLTGEKQIIRAVAGDPLQAHRRGCEFMRRFCRVQVPEADIVIAGNGGYPLDQNVYQAVKGMSGAANVCRPGGVIIMAAACADGHGGMEFYRRLREMKSPAELLRQIKAVSQTDTEPDQWQLQILARILCRYRVIMLAEKAAAEPIRAMQMEYAASLPEALSMAEQSVGAKAKIAVLPDGAAVIAEKISSPENDLGAKTAPKR